VRLVALRNGVDVTQQSIGTKVSLIWNAELNIMLYIALSDF
jgi:hypothetical protein